MEEYPQYPNGTFGDAVPRAGNASGGGQPADPQVQGGETEPNVTSISSRRAGVTDICEVIGRPEWLEDPRYATRRAGYRMMEIFGRFEKWTMTKTKFEAMDMLNKQHPVRADPVDEGDRRRAIAAQTGTVVEVDHPKRGKYLTVGNPDQDVRQPNRCHALASAVEHTEEVLTNWATARRHRRIARRRRDLDLQQGTHMASDKTAFARFR